MPTISTVLYIDDDPEDHELFRLATADLPTPVRLICCESGRTALQILEANQQLVPDYIFVDVEMPTLNGMQTIQALQQMERLKTTKIIVYSDYIDMSLPEGFTNNIEVTDIIRKHSYLEKLKKYLIALLGS